MKATRMQRVALFIDRLGKESRLESRSYGTYFREGGFHVRVFVMKKFFCVVFVAARVRLRL